MHSIGEAGVRGAGIDPPAAPAAQHLALQVTPGCLEVFFPLLQGGVRVPARVGCSLKSLLCDQLGIDADFVAKRILTIFCDSQPVDDLDHTTVQDGSTIALSAAMPGLVGASMRRGGRYAALRRGISHGLDADAKAGGGGTVRIKIFNLLLPELGARILAHGVLLERDQLAELLRHLPAAPEAAPAEADRVLLTVTFGG